ncbi:MAG TPA: TlpA disulfide reductase family protein [Hanamia sp.]
MSCHNLIEVRNEKLPLVPFNQYNFGWLGLVIHIITTKTPNSINLFKKIEMINRILLVLLILMSLKSQAQDPKEILKKSYSKCLTIKNGFYDMEMKMKFMAMKDTTWDIGYKFYFNKLKNDSLYPIAFNSERFNKGLFYIDNRLYTGNELVTYSKNDSMAKIMSKVRWITDLMEARRYDISTFYGPFIDADCKPLPKASDYSDPRHLFKLIAKESLNNYNCYHVQMTEYPKYDSTQKSYTIEDKYDYWINTKDMIPVKYAESTKSIEYGDTSRGFSSCTLKKYELDNSQNLIPLQLSAVPAYYNMQDYVAPKIAELLKDTSAPGWTLKTLDSKNISLSDFKGHFVLIDFFYKDCTPCRKAIPILQSLHEKYKRKGLNVIGIDPFDEENSTLKLFVAKAGITYPVLLDKNNVNQDYRVSSYPTLYLIDKKGNVIYAESGFDESATTKLEELIKSNL